ncbi:hypothetical protein F7725_022708 [Dissostichus mawsoni]|uniref:Uncharacterized protein n=1 Tax=Dissostichus mawsoni TaxID=36200 RepID=A0A7J5YZM6_DISMA|nr:hypothetical protein F7725_022708 [Dissostichus mawsoni]
MLTSWKTNDHKFTPLLCEIWDVQVNQEARKGGVPPLVAVDSVALILLTVQPHTLAPTERQQQALTLHLPPLRRVLIKHHRLHLALPAHQFHRNSLTRVFPHSEGKESSYAMACTSSPFFASITESIFFGNFPTEKEK